MLRLSRRQLAWTALVAAALLFGATFVIVKDALTLLPPHAFVAWRFLLGMAALQAVGCGLRLPGGGLPRDSRLWRDGILAGLLLWLGYALQTMGLQSTTASHSALITGLYVVLTPLLAAAWARRRPVLPIVVGCAVGFAGLALLAAPRELSVGRGDALTLAAAVAFAGHVLVLSRCSARHPTLPFTVVQLLVVAVGSLGLSLALEGLPPPSAATWPALLMTGLGASAGAFVLQVWAQSIVGPARTVLVLSLETVFGAVLGVLLLGEALGLRGWLGAALIVASVQVVLHVRDEDDLPAAAARTPAP